MKKIFFYIKKKWFVAIIIGLMLFALITLMASKVYDVRGNSWLCNVLISFACGIVSGLTLYFLTNVRNVKNIKINEYYSHLRKVMRMMTDIRRDAKHYKENENLWGEETGVCLRCEKLIDRLDIFQDEIYELPDELFIQFTGDFENILTDNVVDAIKVRYDEVEDYDDLSQYEQTYMAIIEYMSAAEKIIKPIYEKYRKLYKESLNSIW